MFTGPRSANYATHYAAGLTALASINLSIIKKIINYVAGEGESVGQLTSGDLVETNKPSQMNDILKLRKLHSYDVTADIPVGMKSCRSQLLGPHLGKKHLMNC